MDKNKYTLIVVAVFKESEAFSNRKKQKNAINFADK